MMRRFGIPLLLAALLLVCGCVGYYRNGAYSDYPYYYDYPYYNYNYDYSYPYGYYNPYPPFFFEFSGHREHKRDEFHERREGRGGRQGGREDDRHRQRR
jgi:hypothetical protein